MLAQSPDLTVTVLEPGAGSVVAPGEPFAISAAVANDGAAQAGASHLRFHVSTDATITPADPVFGATAVVPSLAAGARSVHVATASLPSAGTWWLGACVAAVRGDPPGNNCSAGTPIEVTPPASPDLVVSRPRIAFSRVPPGQAFTVSATVTNLGAAAAGPSILRYRFSDDETITGQDRPFGSAKQVAGLPPEASRQLSTAGSIPTAGTWWLGACVDPVAGDPAGNNCSLGSPIAVNAGLFFAEGFESGTLDPWTTVFPALCPDDLFEASGRNGSDDACFGARIPIGRTQAHAHCDADWLWFDGVAGRTYRIETFALAGGADTTIAVHRGCGATAIAADDDGGPGERSSRVDFTAPANDVYDLRVEEWNDAYGPGRGYRIRVTCIADCG